MLREYLWVDHTFAHFIEQMCSIDFGNMLLCELIKCAELKMLAFFFFGQNRGGGWWGHSCQNASILYVYGIGLLYMKACNHFKFVIYGALEEKATYTVWGERERTQSDFAAFLQCVKEKPCLQGYWHTASTFWFSWESFWCPFSYVSFCLWENCGFRWYAKILSCHWLFKIFIS